MQKCTKINKNINAKTLYQKCYPMVLRLFLANSLIQFSIK